MHISHNRDLWARRTSGPAASFLPILLPACCHCLASPAMSQPTTLLSVVPAARPVLLRLAGTGRLASPVPARPAQPPFIARPGSLSPFLFPLAGFARFIFSCLLFVCYRSISPSVALFSLCRDALPRSQCPLPARMPWSPSWCVVQYAECTGVVLRVRVSGRFQFAFGRSYFRLLCTTIHLQHHTTSYTQHTPHANHTHHLHLHATRTLHAVHLTHTVLTTHLPYLTQPLPPLAPHAHTTSTPHHIYSPHTVIPPHQSHYHSFLRICKSGMVYSL
jgi:hypothetical protein